MFEKVVRHADAQIKHCPRCHAETRACFPHQMPGPLQYGASAASRCWGSPTIGDAPGRGDGW